MIKLEHISLTYKTQSLFDDASVSIDQSDRLGLVGLNGTGKSTLLGIIAGTTDPDSGTLIRDHQVRIAYLPQDILCTTTQKVIDEVVDPTAHTHDASAWAVGKKILAGLGFSEEQIHKPVQELSTGWKMRLMLAKLLVQKADFYLFDEPTNHLDFQARSWFTSFLKNLPAGFIIVSHDKHVLDEVTRGIIEIEQSHLTRYNGNYSNYQEQKQLRDQQIYQAYLNQQKEIARKERTIERFRAQASKARMAQSMEKKLQKEELITPPPAPRGHIHIPFPPLPPAPRTILTVRDLGYAYRNHSVFDHVSFHIERGERAALFAPNGTGKTTLIKLISGELAIQQGSITIPKEVSTNIFHQDQTLTFSQEHRSIWDVVNEKSKKSDAFMRSLLGALLFSGDTIEKPLSVLSGGERVRVGLAKLLARDAQLLILDEPTNHLDIPSQEALLDVLKTYPGTILFVSHDYDFLNSLATNIIELTAHGATRYQGNYESYRDQKIYQEAFKSNASSQTLPKGGVTSAPKQSSPASLEDTTKRLHVLEREIATLEKKEQQLTRLLETLEYQDPRFTQTYEELKKITHKLKPLMDEWEALF